MTAKVKPVPEGTHTVTPHLVIDGAAKAIDFYKKAFGAKETMRMGMPGGGDRVMHAEIKIGDSAIMLADEFPEMGYRGPTSLGGVASSIYLMVDDVDATHKQAVANGAKEMRPLQNQFYGHRTGTIEDPFGHVWTIATQVEVLSPDEMGKRAAAAFAQA